MSKKDEKKSTIKVKLVKSPIGRRKSHRDTVKGLGLRRVNSEENT
jgi:large subunit ribosomal protein L30